jgi:sulfatase-like protein
VSVALAAAIALLNASLSFQNIWPTPAIYWKGELSIELASFLLLLVIAARRLGPPSRATIRWFAALWVLLVAGHYADVTAPALYGREINLYWDLRHIPDVAAMVVRVAPLWLVVLVVAAAALSAVLLYLLFGWAMSRVADAMSVPRRRFGVAVFAALVALLFAVQRLSGGFPPVPVFSTPVTQTYARQVRFVADAIGGSTMVAASPPMDEDLALVRGADVFLVFVESYGAIAYDRPDIAPNLAARRAALAAAIEATGQHVVSAYVESPTFGGSSWLAHVSLMSGVEVRNPEINARLMTQKRETMVTAFARHGYRTVALMPGLRQRWPEGSFYGFDEIYGAEQLDYRGPEFGWFALPDQFSLARLDALEASRTSQPPLFVFFPTISTHFPFSPTPPYQSDWPRMLSGRPYDGAAIVKAYAKEPDWTHFSPGYVDAVSYAYATLEGYLHAHADRDFVMVVLGDHQPPAAVSGEGASWDVPVHVIARRKPILDRLVEHGFVAGITPARPALGRMHSLQPILLEAFSEKHE